jgi:geranylgeranyl reductase family protein
LDADVIVVGSGPAGATAACDLARRGHDVVLLDRKSFPRDKPCGDGVPPGGIEILNDLGMREKIRAAGFYPVYGIRIGSPSGRTWETSFRPKRDGAEFYIAPRERLDSLIHDHAVESGATFVQASVKNVVFDGSRVVGVRAVVAGRDAELTARVVIGADGATSAVSRALQTGGKPPDRQRAVAIRTYINGIATLPNRVEFYFYKRFVPGYGWVFPLGSDRANVGVIMRVDRLRKSGMALEDLLEEFLAMPALAHRLRPGYTRHAVAAWQLSNGSPRPVQRAYPGALLVGDAAGLVDPLTGEGIHNALASGRMAADVAAAAVEKGDSSLKLLAEYDRRCDASLGPPLRRSYRVQSLVALAPWWVDLLFALANANPRRFDSFLDRESTDFAVGRSR